jgi:Mn-dependent DtxR family transcriptional regulator
MKEMTSALEKQGVTVTGTTFASLCAIYRAYNMNKENNRFIISHKTLEQCFYISRYSFTNVLRELEKAGLVKVEWRKGRSPRITLLYTGAIK